MYHFEYVPRREWLPVREELLDMIHQLQDEVREHFTFQYRFVGSSSRNMITRDPFSNRGFDFDVDLEVNDCFDRYSPDQIRQILRRGIDRITNPKGLPIMGYDYAENSTRVLTIKVKDPANSRILHSCDLCIVRKSSDGRRQYIRKNTFACNHTWEYQSEGFDQLPEMIDWIKENGCWQEVRDLYLSKKNRNFGLYKTSRSLFAEAVHEVWQKC